MWCEDTFEGFGSWTYALCRFREASVKMDGATIEAFAKEYNAIGQDEAKRRAFLERLEKIFPASESHVIR